MLQFNLMLNYILGIYLLAYFSGSPIHFILLNINELLHFVAGRRVLPPCLPDLDVLAGRAAEKTHLLGRPRIKRS